MTPLDVLRDALARVVAASEELAVGDTPAAARLLGDLETDLVRRVVELEQTS